MIYVVTTTINVPTFLKDIKGDFKAIVIGDVKTPKETRAFCDSIDAWYLDIDDQKKAIPKELWDMMPFNTGSRKMIGTYLAYQAGADKVIMMDDDNFPIGGRFIKKHSIVGSQVEHYLIKKKSGWFNSADAVMEEAFVPFYPRGYPWSQRFSGDKIAKLTPMKIKIVVNQGLVLGDPDIDAVSRLFWPIEVTAMRPEFEPTFALAPSTWSSFNDQNTALAREIIPVYFKPPSGGRNADIWACYIVQRHTGHMGDVVAFGHPLVRQIRNEHDLREDYRLEELNNIATDDFVALLRGVKLTKDTYIDALGELIDGCLNERMVDLNSKQSRHSQFPSEETQMEKVQAVVELIDNFFTEYKAWYNFWKEEFNAGRSRDKKSSKVIP